ncbi:unannotated protein [freshwater metagenome]|uniref:Unannotated protein n=1 Tax=freshwater metagenome TaxID=449393 RepID=A0A6J7L9Q2_9ZZZZ
MNLGPRRLAGDPARGTVGRRDTPVESGGHLPRDKGAGILLGEGPGGVERLALIGHERARHGDSPAAQDRGAAAGYRVRVDLPEHHARYPRLSEGGSARAGATGMGAGLEGDHSGSPSGRVACHRERFDLGVWLTSRTMVAHSDHLALARHDDCSHARVGVRPTGRTSCRLEGEFHGTTVGDERFGHG